MTDRDRDRAERESVDGSPCEAGRFAFADLDRLIHERARLSIMTSLAAHGRGLLFSDLKRLCALTDGNLSRHLQVLQEEGLVEVWKNTSRRRPQTLCRLSESGRDRFTSYLERLEAIVSEGLAASSERAELDRRSARSTGNGFSPA